MLPPSQTCLRAISSTGHTPTRGAVPTGYEHGASYGGYLATGFNSSMVNDDEAASRAEYRYQQVQGHASEDAGLWGPVWLSTPQCLKQSTSDVLQRSRGGEPVLARPRSYRGHHGKDGTTSRGLDSCASDVVLDPFGAVQFW
jgi:hypothetical protein